ncbi:MAG: hypothetical protein DRZ82_08935 [Thermoprotei archaeon]|nr:MAG: hypothetical protein DRZ82_08935 [Thermoprotei archaeon]
MSTEVDQKIERLLNLMIDESLDAIILATRRNLSWITGGGEFFVNMASERGIAIAVITKEERLIFTSNNEAPRLLDEENIEKYGFTLRSIDWYLGSPLEMALKYIKDKGLKRIGSDIELAYENVRLIEEKLTNLRINLTKYEIERYRAIGKECANILRRVCYEIRRGITEQEISGMLHSEFYSRGIRLPVVLIAADDRAFKYRHPIPKGKKLNKYAIISIVAEKYGLHVALTRSVSIGKPSEEVIRKHNSVSRIMAIMMMNTRPGVKSGEIIRKAIEAYKNEGYPNEWKLHHQGGWIGYMPREKKVLPDTEDRIGKWQALAWNPTISGVKSEDTIIVEEKDIVNITEDPKWPTLEIEVNGKIVRRPEILLI